VNHMAENKVKEQDWRGIIAVVVLVMFGASAGATMYQGNTEMFDKIVSMFLPIVSLILGFYFGGKTSEYSPEELKALTGGST